MTQATLWTVLIAIVIGLVVKSIAEALGLTPVLSGPFAILVSVIFFFADKRKPERRHR